ncbi:hypothetical protein PVK06_004336 [Gossypium arboreum]|uniref:Uncharacterized protein n=1 Tax=Gossypium arboreum TaxID=29729 RepID=A0ABR0QRS3_GOSAR|nr:hypothetical protein PVK06_004336 [Gossypium arboreum]
MNSNQVIKVAITASATSRRGGFRQTSALCAFQSTDILCPRCLHSLGLFWFIRRLPVEHSVLSDPRIDSPNKLYTCQSRREVFFAEMARDLVFARFTRAPSCDLVCAKLTSFVEGDLIGYYSIRCNIQSQRSTIHEESEERSS